jgi:hypothetical protein
MRVGGKRHAPAALPPRITRDPFYRRPVRPQGRSGRVLKISPPPGFDPTLKSRFLHKVYFVQRCKIPGSSITTATKFVRWHLILSALLLQFFVLAYKNVSVYRHQVTVGLTGHSRIVGPQCGTCFVSPFWRLEYVVGSYVFGNFLTPDLLCVPYDSQSKVRLFPCISSPE